MTSQLGVDMEDLYLNGDEDVTDAQEFNTGSSYSAGDKVTYSGSLYEFTKSHSAGAWTGTDVKELGEAGDVDFLKVNDGWIKQITNGGHVYDASGASEMSLDLFYKTLLARYAERPFTAVISTHLIEEISHLIEDVVILHHGQVLAQAPEELLAGGYTVSGPKGWWRSTSGAAPAGDRHPGRPDERPPTGRAGPGLPAPGSGALQPGLTEDVRADDQRPGANHCRVPQNVRRRGMKLKQSIRYQLADFIGPVIVYYGIVAAAHVVLFLAWIFTPATIHLGGGLTVFSGLFLFICGLCSFHDNLPMHLQNGVSRKTMYTAWLVVTVIVSAAMAAADTVLATLIDLLNLPSGGALPTCSSPSLTWKAWALGPPLSTRCSPSPSALCCWRC